VKVYHKASVLRVETVINNPREFKILRVVTDADGGRSRRWCPIRKGVSDLWRCYQVGMAANQRYLRAISAAPLKGEGVAALDALCRPRNNRGRHVARFNPLSATDLALFKAAMVGQHNIVGFRNADLTVRLYRRPPADSAEAHRRCERVSRLIVKLRGHGRIAKVPRARLYRVTAYGQRVMTAAVAIHDDRYPRTTSLQRHRRLTCLSRHANLAGVGSTAGWWRSRIVGVGRNSQRRRTPRISRSRLSGSLSSQNTQFGEGAVGRS
jgi:hypothetical protein